MSEPLLLVITGPSGAGKDTLLDRLEASGVPFHRVVTATTRPRRPSEPPGHYIFLTPEQFERDVQAGRFLEHAGVYERRYGVPRDQVLPYLERGENVFLRTDIQGARTLKQQLPYAVVVFVRPSSVAELEDRLRTRASEDEEQMRRRIQTAEKELRFADRCDYVVDNRDGDLESAVRQLMELIRKELSERSLKEGVE